VRVEQVAHRGFGVTKNLTQEISNQAAMVDPTLSRGIGLEISGGPLEPQLLCDSVKFVLLRSYQ